MTPEQRPCDFCLSYESGGQLIVSRDSRVAEQSWTTVRTLENYCLCAACFDEVCTFIGIAVGPNERRPAGWPTTVVPDSINSDHCNVCGAQFTEKSYPVETIPTQLARVRRGVYHRVGHTLQMRVCVGCVAWVRSRLYEDSGVRGGSMRGQAERQREFVPDGCTALFSVFLGREDELRLKIAAAENGCQYRGLRPSEARDSDIWSGGTVFVGSGGSGLATMLAESLPAPARARMVVVSRLDSVSDMAGALRKGAGDFLTSPLTTRQIVGACGRIEERAGTGALLPHDSGLTILRPSNQSAGRAHQVLQVGLPDSSCMLEAAWLLRRFLRGSDRVGVDEKGTLLADVCCPDELTDEVVRRMMYILGAAGDVIARQRTSPQVDLRRSA